MARLLSGSGTLSGVATQAELDLKAPLASPDFTGTVDLTGTTLSLDNDQISGDKVSGGTIGAGTWEGTDIAVAHGGTGASTHTANNVLVGAGTDAITSIAPSTSGNLLTLSLIHI